MTLKQLFWKLIKEKFHPPSGYFGRRKISPFIRLFWEEKQKHLQSSQNNVINHSVNPDTDVTNQAVKYFSSDK